MAHVQDAFGPVVRLFFHGFVLVQNMFRAIPINMGRGRGVFVFEKVEITLLKINIFQISKEPCC